MLERKLQCKAPSDMQLKSGMAFRKQFLKDFFRYAGLRDVIELQKESETGFCRYRRRETRYPLRDCYSRLTLSGSASTDIIRDANLQARASVAGEGSLADSSKGEGAITCTVEAA
jgi:hypothetical protein